MLVSDVMTTNVVSIPSGTNLAEANHIMEAHHFRRIPVIDRGKLVGIVSKDELDKSGPSKLTSFSIHEITYMLYKMTVDKIMKRDVVTAPPTMNVEQAVRLAQSKRVGALIVVEDGKVVGICTTNDLFYRICNPVLGIGMPGSRIVIRDCYKGPDIEKVISTINKAGVCILNLFVINLHLPDIDKHELIIHLDITDNNQVIEDISKLGFVTENRLR